MADLAKGINWIVPALLLTTAPSLACQYPIEQEKAKWAAQGLSVGEVSAPLIIRAIENHLGEHIEADQVFVLSRGDAPNVVIVFASLGCPHSTLVISKEAYRELIKTSGA